MNFKSFFSAILAAVLMLVGCTKENLKPAIKAVAIEISKDAGTYELPYQVENASSGNLVSASVDVEWIYEVTVQEGKVVFKAEQNAENTRTAVMTLSYPGAPDLSVNIIQKSVFEGVFNISVSDITPYSARVTYTPVEYSGNYIFFVMNKESIKDYLLDAEGLEQLYQGDLKYVQDIAEQNGLSLEECLRKVPQIYTLDGKETVMDYTDLKFNTEYVAYCYGMDFEGKRMTDFVMKEFSTALVDQSDITFEAETSMITRNSAKIVITPSNTDTYYWTYISEMDYAKYNLEEIMSNMIANIKYESQNSGKPISSFIHSGPSDDHPNNLWAGTKYYIIAWGMDEGGSPTTEAREVASFTTVEDPIVDDCKFTLDVTQVKPMDIQVKVTPTKETTRYYVAFVEESKCEGYNDKQMAQRIVNMENSRFEENFYAPEKNNWTAQTFTGTQTIWGKEDLDWNFLADRMYRIYVFGVDPNKGVISTEVARVDQRTEKAEQSDMTINVEVTKSTWNFGTFKFTPSKNDEYYLPFLLETQYAALYKNPDGTYNESALLEEIEHYYDGDLIYNLKKGPVTMDFYWTSDTEYTMLVFGYSGMNTTPFFETETKSPVIPFEQSQAEVEATYELFDGTALATKFPEKWDIKEYEGSCLMVMRFYPNEHTRHWYGGVWAPISNYETGVDHLMALIRNTSAPANAIDVYQQTCRPWYNTKWSFSYVAEGDDEKYGKWHYEEFTPTVDKTVEPYDFWSNPNDGTKVFAVSKVSKDAPVDITDEVFKPADGKYFKQRAASHKTTKRIYREL